MIQLSAVIITFNEEKNIGRCLESVKDIADEIIVVDSFSTDQTEAICKNFEVRFLKHPFAGHIEQKNFATAQASFAHVLSLDADEALDETLQKAILEVKKNWRHDGYTMNRLTNYCGQWIRYCGWYPDVKLRLWDRRKGRWGGINPHDRFELLPGCSAKHLEGDILHFSYYTVEEHFRQSDYFSGVSAQALYNNGKKTSLLSRLISPVARFLRDYFLKLGFLEGKAGFTISRMNARTTRLKYQKLAALWKAGVKR